MVDAPKQYRKTVQHQENVFVVIGKYTTKTFSIFIFLLDNTHYLSQ